MRKRFAGRGVASIAGTCLCSGVAFAVVLGARLPALVGAGAATAQSVISAVTLLSVAGATLIATRPQHSLQRINTPALVRHVALSAVTFSAFVTATDAADRVAWSIATVVWLNAACEEIVFRLLLPRRLEQVLATVRLTERGRTVLVQGMAQVTFALCHYVSGNRVLDTTMWIEPVVLLAAGVWYAVIVAIVGVWWATAVHAAVNLELLQSAQFQFARISPIETFGWLIVGMWLVASLSPRIYRDAATREV